MISIKSEREISLMKKAGNIVYRTHKYLEPYIKPGITTKELDKLAYDFIISQDATPSFLNYEGYPASICTSINEEVVHGIPSNRKLKNGDIIGIDIGACYKGYHGDSAWSYQVGSVSREKAYLLEHTEKALFEGLKPLKENICDRCNHELKSRTDDTKEVFIHRFETYLNSTKDLIEYYENLGLLHKIDVSNKNAETIFEEVKEILND